MEGSPSSLALLPRQRFVETAYWNPGLVTDAQGKARVTFRAPIGPVAIRRSRPGASPAPIPWSARRRPSLVVRKDFFVDLKVPASLTEGDKPAVHGAAASCGHDGYVHRCDWPSMPGEHE